MRPCRLLAAVAMLLVGVLVAGCSVTLSYRTVAAPAPAPAPGAEAEADSSFVRGSDGGDDDRLAAASIRELERFWARAFPELTGRALRPVAEYHSVDPSRADQQVPCLRSPAEIAGNAFYCPAADVIGYDRTALIPGLREEFGDAAATVVLAHEFGHAVQQRLGIGIDDLPTIVAEAQADCYGGLFLRQVREGATGELTTDADGVDRAMAALVTFRDPVGTGAEDPDAHGNSFDRVTSFQVGFDGAAADCAAIDVANREFTQTDFDSLQDRSTEGNLALPELIEAMGPDLDRFFGEVVRARGATWTAPALDAGTTCDGAAAQGPVAACVGDGPPSVTVDAAALDERHRAVGDYASGTLLAARHAVVALDALGEPTEGEDAGRTALCLTGAYTASVGDADGGFGLSPGDLDEAVAVLLTSPDAATDALGAPGAGTGYERVRVFRTGVDGGPDACL